MAVLLCLLMLSADICVRIPAHKERPMTDIQRTIENLEAHLRTLTVTIADG
ncbi:Uncharacterized protein dnm_049210 [Desulfonema magnum]|uniref:Uncharacterized protein n=1 Tax=Desulfonema magnum TaxID=45655 RepID=A0A975GPI6_9BACT|nr:Uncharacterized protein dnm_049210 [Desulfonema magnum]